MLPNKRRCTSTRQKFNYVLKNHPKVFSFQISYLIELDERGLDLGSESTDLLKLMQMIPNTFKPGDLFGEVELLEAAQTTYYFRGFIVFKSNHYYAYFRDLDAESPSQSWIKYNDCQITRIGDWEEVVQSVTKVREQPILLLFEAESYHKGLERHYLNELIGKK